MKRFLRRTIGWVIGFWYVASGRRRQMLKRYDIPGVVLSVFSHKPTRTSFEQVVRWLIRNGFSFISADDLIDTECQKARVVWLSFDDGWESLGDDVIPILNKYQIPATIFVAPNDQENVSRGRLMDVKELYRLARENPLITLENHTMTHRRAAKIPVETFAAEVVQCSKILKAETGREPRLCCYPYGVFTDETQACVRRMGLRPVSTLPGVMTVDSLFWNRNMFGDDLTLIENVGRILGAWRKIKSPV